MSQKDFVSAEEWLATRLGGPPKVVGPAQDLTAGA
jgi:hypothetical protein